MARQAAKQPSERQLRVGEEIRHVMSGVLLRDEIYDEALKGVMIMITEVRVSPDFSWATAFVRTVGKADNDAVVDALNAYKGVFRKQIGKSVRLRITPDVRFVLDDSFDESAKIDALLNDPKVRADIEKVDEE